MSQPPTSQTPPPIAVGPATLVPPPSAAAVKAAEGPIARLRAELDAATDKLRRAKLQYEIGEVEEFAGDETNAARDYLAAFNADPSFREPLEGLVRLLERRRSMRNLGKLIEALVRAADTKQEKARALLMKAAFAEDVSADLETAKAAALEAAELGAPSAETAFAWLTLELLASKLGDPALRARALEERAKRDSDPTWKALLLLDCGRLAAGAGDMNKALSLCAEARKLGSGASYIAAVAEARTIRNDPGAPGSEEAKARLAAYAETLEAQAELIREARADAARGDALGVPRWARDSTHMVEHWLRAAEAHRLRGENALAASVLDRALKELGANATDSAGIVETALVNERMHIAELMGDTALASQLAEKRIANELDGGVAAALAMRVAEHAAGEGDAARALDAVSRAVAKDPMCVPARALQLDLLADGGDSAQFASQVEAVAEQFENEEARGRAFLLAAFVWGAQAGDVAGAKAALSQAAMYGVPPAVLARTARMLAAVQGDTAWHEEATRRLISNGATEAELAPLWFEIVRSKLLRGDTEGAAKAIGELRALPAGAWLAQVLAAFVPGQADDRRRTALEELATLEGERERVASDAVMAAMRAQQAGDVEAAKARLRPIAAAAPGNLFVASYLAGLERAGGAHAAAAAVTSACAAAAGEETLAGALYLEAGFDRWNAGDKTGALEAFEEAARLAPVASQNALAWAWRALAGDIVPTRRKALERALEAGEDADVVALERLATELGGGDPDEAAAALSALEKSDNAQLLNAASLARLSWTLGASDWDALRAAVARIGALGETANTVAAAEQVRLARDGDPEGLVEAAGAWFDAGGGMASALEWVAGVYGRPEEEGAARHKAAEHFAVGPLREAVHASAALLSWAAKPDAWQMHFLEGESQATRLANLELAHAGVDPRRRAKGLVDIQNVLGEDVQVDALALAGWSLLAAGDNENAVKAFTQAARARTDDVSSWEGLRAAAEAVGDAKVRAEAAEELGARCADNARGAAFWEEAALLWLEQKSGERAEIALDASFARDASRPIAFDKLFRRVRERKEGDKLLALIERRLEVSEDPKEMVKLYWERSRVLREKGDIEGALVALENVTMVEPDHVGALALSGEIFIRRGQFAEAAEALGRLAGVKDAPPKNRVTAGIAAVDLYENKLDRFDKALEILLVLHHARLTTLPVRERLARAAARTGAWAEAADILEELMNERADAEGRTEAAQLAMAIRRDRLNDRQAAAAAVIKLLEESPGHGDAIDLLLVIDIDPLVRKRLLETARVALLAGTQTQQPVDPANAHRLAVIAHELGDPVVEQAALGVATALGSNDSEGTIAFAQLVSRKPRAPQIALTETMLQKVIAPGDEGPLVRLFSLLGPTLAEALGPSLGALGVGRRDKVDPRSGLALRHEIAAWAGALGVPEFDLYVGGKDPNRVQGVPGEVPALVVGAGVNAPLSPGVRARIARELFAISRGTTVLRSRDETSIAAIVVSACKLGDVRVDSPAYAMLAEVEKSISKAIARKTRKLLPEICQKIVSSRADARVWAKRALATLDRVSVLASGDVADVLADVLGVSVERLPAAVAGNARAEELAHFVLSPTYFELRRSLGLEGTS